MASVESESGWVPVGEDEGLGDVEFSTVASLDSVDELENVNSVGCTTSSLVFVGVVMGSVVEISSVTGRVVGSVGRVVPTVGSVSGSVVTGSVSG